MIKRIWKEAAMAQSEYYPGIFLEIKKKSTQTSVRVAYTQVRIRTKHFPVISLEN
jgi:hypothetical protein